ncbi:hypothetical protein KBD34_00055 [Patescibacteria group bacterium]|nr:hypothetical protein [Patescibacteria group bacterium]
MFRALCLGIVTGCLMLGVGLMANVPTVSALTISPPILELQANPGETKTATITLTNDEGQPIHVYPSIQKFLPLGTNGQQQFLPPDDLDGLPSWTFLDGADRILETNEKQTVTMEIRVPTDAQSGGMYEAVFFSSEPPLSLPGVRVGVRSRIGALVLLTVGDAKEIRLAATDWRWLSESVSDSLRGTVRLTLRNTGGTHTVPTGEIVARDLFGRVVGRWPINPAGSRILPASERTFEQSIGGESMGGFSRELTALGLGRYQLSLEGVNGLTVVPEALSVVVFPWRVVSAICLLLIGLFVAFRVYRSRLIRAMQTRS